MTISLTQKVNVLGLDLTHLQAWLTTIGEKPYRATQIMQWIHTKGVCDFENMTNLSQSLRKTLATGGEIKPPQIIHRHLSHDNTRKWLMRLSDGNCIETVFIPEKTRGTLCISSQVGCILNCDFCSTGKQGFSRNLNTAEIILQLFL